MLEADAFAERERVAEEQEAPATGRLPHFVVRPAKSVSIDPIGEAAVRVEVAARVAVVAERELRIGSVLDSDIGKPLVLRHECVLPVAGTRLVEAAQVHHPEHQLE